MFIFYIFWEDLAARIIQDYRAYHIKIIEYDFVKVSNLVTKPLKMYQYGDFEISLAWYIVYTYHLRISMK